MRKKFCLSSFVQECSYLVDQGEKYSIEEIYEHIEKMDLVEWLEKTYPFGSEKGLDFSVYKEADRKFINEEYESMYIGYSGKHERKWGIKNNGLNLLVAWGVGMILDLKDPDTML
ncbi:hypothetical protein [Chengkuizengella axinellae]|uniref:Uncharacterized protein n=1 Tax=Chengkuizengella axinellae TaxID=3064388 RepID=A0ABT9J6D1_9BACL|nr:hypothetical protein [Chengkuizengella sp. 2205SS18-9]MDP5277160.1 hypothetical protein [Chengkuizengella sp. 2205SS18-9]